MDEKTTVRGIAEALKRLASELDRLAAAGEGIPAVEKNVVRMRGALRQLEVQFVDLDEIAP